MDSSFSSFGFVLLLGFFTILGTLVFLVYKKGRSKPQNKTLPSSSSSSLDRRYDVFPSFHGADVRKSFLSHIMKEFRRRGIDPFIDNDIERSKSIGPELTRAIRGSRSAIVMLSRNYASSSWCLDELVEVLICRAVLGLVVVTVFYEVDPTDVKKQTGDFGKFFRKTCKGKPKGHIDRWRRALEDVAVIPGYHSRHWRDEASLIEDIANKVSEMVINFTPSSYFDPFVGLEAHIEKMAPMLCLESDEVRMIGILGPSGIGKTTIARSLYQKLSSGFQHSAFMDDIKSRYPRPCYDEYTAMLQLQQHLISVIMNLEDISIPHLRVLRERLYDKKVLVVLDDVDRLEQLEALAKEPRWFGLGSRIIITTEDPGLLKAHGITHIYKVDFPAPDEALQIFCMNAFGQKSPKDGFLKLAQEVTQLAGELPLSLKFMGSYLRGMSMEKWEEELPTLKNRLDEEMGNITDTDISNTLTSDDECLDSDEANMHEGILKAHMEKMEPMLCLDSDEVRIIGISGPSGTGKTTFVKFLYQQRSQQFQWGTFVADIEGSNATTCHNEYGTKLQLQNQLLSQQSNQNDTDESFNLGDAQKMLKGKKMFVVLDGVDGLGQLNALVKETQCFGPGSRIIITAQDSRLLKAHGINHIYEMGFPAPDEALQIFCMSAFGQKSPGDGFVKLAEEVTELTGKLPLGLRFIGSYLRGMPMEEWKKELPRLRNRLDGEMGSILQFIIDSLGDEDKELFHQHIASISNGDGNETEELYTSQRAFEGISNGLLRRECFPMTCWPSKWHPEYLFELYMPDSKLEKLWEGIHPLKNLRLMDLSSSKNLKGLPDLSTAINLKRVDLRCCSSLVELPHSIGDATGLLELILDYCTSLVDLPSSIGNNSNLKKLYLTGCSSLVKLPSSIGSATNLQELCLRCCSSFVELPSSIENATNLQILNLEYCSSLVNLPSSIGDAINLKELYLTGCSSLVELPASIGNATNLQKLNLEYCSSLVNLPSSIGNSVNLKELYLIGCSSLVDLPASIGHATNLEILDLGNCSSLVGLPSSIGDINSLHYLNLSNCSCLVFLPSSIGNATNLWELVLNNCSSLVELPSSIGDASGLKILDLSNCSRLLELPSSIGNATNLEYLYLSNCSSLRKLPSSIGYATSLQYLYLNNCSNLMEVPYSIGNAINLKKLDLCWCTSLVKLPASIMNSTSLWQLDLDNCSSLLEVPTGVGLKKLDLSV